MGRHKKTGEFAPHKANPYIGEQPDMFAPIDTPRYVPTSELITPEVEELIAEWANRARGGYPQGRFPDLPTYTWHPRGSGHIARAASEEYVIEELSKLPIVTIGRDAYTKDEWNELPKPIQIAIHEVEPSKTRIAEMIAGMRKDVEHRLPDENQAYNDAQRHFNDDDIHAYIDQEYVEAIAEEFGLDESAVEEHIGDLLSDSDYWGEIQEGSDGERTYETGEWPVELRNTFHAFKTTAPTYDEFKKAVEIGAEDHNIPSEYDLAFSILFNVDNFYNREGKPVRYPPDVYVYPPWQFSEGILWNDVDVAMRIWAEDERAEAPDAEVAVGVDEAERLAEQHRLAEVERARVEATRKSALQQRILTYVRTGLPWEERIVYTFADGTYIVALDSFVELRMESVYLRHCIGKSSTLIEEGAHWWPEYYVDELVDIYSMRPPGYETMGKEKKRKASFLTIAVWRMDDVDAFQHSQRIGREIGRDPLFLPGLPGAIFTANRVADIRGFDNRPAGYTKREGQGTRSFNVDETKKLLMWWKLGMGRTVRDLLSTHGGTEDMIRAMAERIGWVAPDPLSYGSSPTVYLDVHFEDVLGYEPEEGARQFFDEGDWPRENPDDDRAPHVCAGEGFCAPPWCELER